MDCRRRRSRKPTKTIEELEGKVWGEPEYGSHVVTNAHRLRKKPTDQFTVEDLRFMIGQNVGTEHIMARALGVLESNPLACGDFYPGDLLRNVLRVSGDYWRDHPVHLDRALGAMEAAERLLQERVAKRAEQRQQETAWWGNEKPGEPDLDEKDEADFLDQVRSFLQHHRAG